MCLSVLKSDRSNLLEEGIYRNHEYAITFNSMGYRCGYVKLTKNHKYYGTVYQDIDVNVHGGLTFSDYDVPCEKDGPDDGYWIGFDCGHFWDQPDLTLPIQKEYLDSVERISKIMPDGKIRSTDYVRGQCYNLIDQL